MMNGKNITRSGLTAAILAVLMLAGCNRQDQKAPPGVIPNSSFNIVSRDLPRHWEIRTWSGDGDFSRAAIGHDDDSSVMISSGTGADASWSAVVRVKPYSTYRFSGWVKTDSLMMGRSKGALFNLHGISGAETEAVSGTRDWTELSMTFETGRNDAVILNCLFGGWGRATGRAWFDDLNLDLIQSWELHPHAVVDAEQVRDTISPYIYGQFIEHLGRCIYGGIWAEMLEDRKFYYPVSDTYQPWEKDQKPVWESGIYAPIVASPWKVIGPAGTVSMDTGHPYAGKHSPVIELPGDGLKTGIRQEGLALKKGAAYEGRLVLAAEPGAGPVTVRLVSDKNKSVEYIITDPDASFNTYTFQLVAPASADNGVLEISSRGTGAFTVGAVSLMPADNIRGWRPDVIALLRELDAPIYRWPGGNFVSGYDWRDGIGDRDRRPPRKNPAWTGVEPNDVGLHEYLDLMDLIGAEPFITVNTGLGGASEAAREVAYCNSPADSPLGKIRAKNGHSEPYRVTWWAVGNEMYGSWQLGYMPLEDYVIKHNRTVDAMRRVDPEIKLVAVGSVGRWSRTMLEKCGDHMDLLSEHIYCQERPGLLGHTAWLAEMIDAKADAHRRYRREIPGLAQKDIRIAMDEWNYWYGPYIYGELGTRYFLKDGLGVAIGLHAYFRNSDLYYMANYAQTVNVIGCIKTSRTEAVFAATGEVLMLYRRYYGTIPVQIGGAPEPLDVAAAWKNDRKTLTVAIVNPTEASVDFPLELQGIVPDSPVVCHFISGSDPQAYNEPGKPLRIKIKQETKKGLPSVLKIPELSVSIYEINTHR